MYVDYLKPKIQIKIFYHPHSNFLTSFEPVDVGKIHTDTENQYRTPSKEHYGNEVHLTGKNTLKILPAS